MNPLAGAVHLLAANPAAFLLFMFLLGLVVGSFLNVVIYRLPRRMEQEWKRECCMLLELPAPADERKFGLVHPRSRCPQCDHSIAALDNIPLLSWMLLRGRCRHCRSAIPFRYPLIEFLAGIAAAGMAWRFGFGLQALAAAVLAWSLLALSAIDLDWKLLPDDITLPMLWLGLLLNMLGVFTDVYSSLLGAMAGYFSLWIVYQGFKLLTGKEGMGYGDFKLLAVLGAWMGWQMLPLIIVLSSAVGAVVGITSIFLLRQDRSEPIPFGPYLAGGGVIALLCGMELTSAYLRWAAPG